MMEKMVGSCKMRVAVTWKSLDLSILLVVLSSNRDEKKQGSFHIEIKFVPTTILWSLLSVLSQTQTKLIGLLFLLNK
jgi:hypothetical protein